jgi:hypothetical protein
MSLKQLIVEWISNDNRMEELRAQIDEIDEAQDDLTDKILTNVEDNSMVGRKVTIPGGSIEFKSQTHYPSLTQKIVTAALAKHDIDPTPILKTIRELKSREQSQQTHMVRHYVDIPASSHPRITTSPHHHITTSPHPPMR